jgi:hypothetical protein
MKLADLPCFPCIRSADPRLNKTPACKHGFKDAAMQEPASEWGLVGVPSGAASGIDVLDIDPSGMEWLAQNEGRLPKTRRHRTQRGVHLLFAHASGVRNSIENPSLR